MSAKPDISSLLVPQTAADAASQGIKADEFAILLPAAAAVREKERGTVEQLLVSPLSPVQILLPKVLAMGGAILLAILLLGVCVVGGVAFWGERALHRIPALTDYEGRPTAGSGTNWLLVGSDSREGLTEEQQSDLSTGGDLGSGRTDTILFVNGIPLVFAEFKEPNRPVKAAFDENLTDYRDTIPQLFVPNLFVLLSNGSEAKIGSTYAGWEFFGDWKVIDTDGNRGVVALETAIRGTCTHDRLLDMLENFVAYIERPGGLVKVDYTNGNLSAEAGIPDVLYASASVGTDGVSARAENLVTGVGGKIGTDGSFGLDGRAIALPGHNYLSGQG